MTTGFVNDHALILYVYLDNYDDAGDESVLTVWVAVSIITDITNVY